MAASDGAGAVLSTTEVFESFPFAALWLYRVCAHSLLKNHPGMIACQGSDVVLQKECCWCLFCDEE